MNEDISSSRSRRTAFSSTSLPMRERISAFSARSRESSASRVRRRNEYMRVDLVPVACESGVSCCRRSRYWSLGRAPKPTLVDNMSGFDNRLRVEKARWVLCVCLAREVSCRVRAGEAARPGREYAIGFTPGSRKRPLVLVGGPVGPPPPAVSLSFALTNGWSSARRARTGRAACRLAWAKTVTARCGPVMFCRRWRFWPQQILIAF